MAESVEEVNPLDKIDEKELIEKLKQNPESLNALKIALMNLMIEGTSFEYNNHLDDGKLSLSTDESLYQFWDETLMNKIDVWVNSGPPEIQVVLNEGEIESMSTFADNPAFPELQKVYDKYIGQKPDKELLMQLKDDLTHAFHEHFD